MGLIIERIPHKSVAYAFLEVQAASANEFESLRAEALKRAPHYGFAQAAPAEPKQSVVEPAAATAEATEAEEGAAEAPQASSPPSAPTEGLSPREKAKLKMAAKKGA